METLQYVLGEGKKTGIHVLTCRLHHRGHEGGELTDMERCGKPWRRGFTDDGMPLKDAAWCSKAME